MAGQGQSQVDKFSRIFTLAADIVSQEEPHPILSLPSNFIDDLRLICWDSPGLSPNLTLLSLLLHRILSLQLKLYDHEWSELKDDINEYEYADLPWSKRSRNFVVTRRWSMRMMDGKLSMSLFFDDLVAFCDFVIVQESSFSQVPTRSLEFLRYFSKSLHCFSGSYAPFRVPALFLGLLRTLSSPRAVSQAPTHPFESPRYFLAPMHPFESLRCFSGSYASFRVPTLFLRLLRILLSPCAVSQAPTHPFESPRYFSKPLRCLSSSHAPFRIPRYLSIPEHYLESPRYPLIPEPFSRNPVPFLESPRRSSRLSQLRLSSSRLLTTPFQVPLDSHDSFPSPSRLPRRFPSPSQFPRRFFESFSLFTTFFSSPSQFP
ncbi:hypothetical protein BS47DRAFT_1392898 [Hydnum rufescens UP504]|uniref:Uncharacterized protein n=1 Tax=Hydnum rufescens UP504 TaxID=1448309 RepID=A0A9P6DT23_9AGAM|nr:hypothetical protein BS47DRAFT_1392898 [Hydnum rufescens UP504]